MKQHSLSDILGDGYKYLYANDGMQALEVLEKRTDIDLLLLDINMPKLDGFGVLEVMNERHWMEDLPVIIISAEDDANFIRRAYDLGATDYINRPFNLTVVQRRVSNTLMLYARQKRLVQLVEDQVYEREKTNSTMVNILSHVIESRNNETGVHLLHVRTLTELLLRQLMTMTGKYKLTESDISMITTISALHDIGKIGVPTKILNKPGRLTPEEFEIMKSHTTIGDALLNEVPIAQDDPLMRVAHEICRHHHERWDGRGYPDGLRGDDIPISAQVVAIADVYDALTSDRCYKKAFPHDKAIEMINAGECGAFNPLLLDCLNAVAKLLDTAMQQDAASFDYQSEARRLTTEVLEQKELPMDDRVRHLLTIEQAKTAFFAQQCGGIQFEYDKWLNEGIYTDWYAEAQKRRHVLYLTDGDSMELMKTEDWERLQQLVRAATPERPDVVMEVLIPVGKNWRWRRLHARTIWTSGTDCAGCVGQFTDIHDEVVGRGLSAIAQTRPDTACSEDTLRQLRSLFGLVRLVNPDNCKVLSVRNDGTLAETNECCYAIWGRDTCCENCSSSRALAAGNWTSKLELRGEQLYFVLSHFQNVGGKQCILEIASMLDENLSPTAAGDADSKAGTFLLSFYRDALTRAYSRQYLENFLPSLEHTDGVAIIDVDKFKQINDTYGHPVGDEALKHIASVILACIRDKDTLIRYGGDEFLLLFSGISEEVFYRRLGQIRNAVRNNQMPSHPDIRLDISIGGVYHVTPLAEAIRQADQKMYESKAVKTLTAKEDLT